VHKAQPGWEISVLIRDRQKAKQIQEAYPDVKIVLGSLDDAEIIKNAASTADIVIRERISQSPNNVIRTII
jgi:Trk K+ transport system NAD-binding subunit